MHSSSSLGAMEGLETFSTTSKCENGATWLSQMQRCRRVIDGVEYTGTPLLIHKHM